MAGRDFDRFFIVTGGPGSGKTVLLNRLQAQDGLRVMSEAGRAIIRDQVRIGGRALPWADRAAFSELMLAADMRTHGEASASEGVVLFDRGVPDVIGYLTLCGLDVPEHVSVAGRLFRYSSQVFIAPPWRELYETDAERKQSLEEAEATYLAMVDVYGSLGYELIELPRVSIAERATFVSDIVMRQTCQAKPSPR